MSDYFRFRERTREKFILCVVFFLLTAGIVTLSHEDESLGASGQRDSGVIGHVSSPSLENFETTHNGQGMRITVKRPWDSKVDQYETVVSLPDEATVYSTIFYANEDINEYTISKLFPLQARLAARVARLCNSKPRDKLA